MITILDDPNLSFVVKFDQMNDFRVEQYYVDGSSIEVDSFEVPGVSPLTLDRAKVIALDYCNQVRKELEETAL